MESLQSLFFYKRLYKYLQKELMLICFHELLSVVAD